MSDDEALEWEDINGRHDPEQRYGLYRLCVCEKCGGKGKVPDAWKAGGRVMHDEKKCPECRGEGRVRELVYAVATPEAVGQALVIGGQEGEWEDCPFGLLDRQPDCPDCERKGCATCGDTGIKKTGTWLLLPWLPSARNVSDAAKLLATSKRKEKKV